MNCQRDTTWNALLWRTLTLYLLFDRVPQIHCAWLPAANLCLIAINWTATQWAAPTAGSRS